MPDQPSTSSCPARAAASAAAPTRRAALRALGLATVGLAASACSVEVRNPWAGSPPARTTGPARAHRSPDLDEDDPQHDIDLAAQALGLVRETLDLVERTGHRHHALRRRYAALRAMHHSHVAALVDAVPRQQRVRPSPHRVEVPRSADRARRAVTAAETGLRTQLAALAQRAASGDLARLLAAMSAAVAQRQDLAGHLTGSGAGA